MTISIQRWLSVRLDFFGNLLILGIGLFAAGFRNTVNPSKIGVVLSYSLSSKLSHLVARTRSLNPSSSYSGILYVHLLNDVAICLTIFNS